MRALKDQHQRELDDFAKETQRKREQNPKACSVHLKLAMEVRQPYLNTVKHFKVLRKLF